MNVPFSSDFASIVFDDVPWSMLARSEVVVVDRLEKFIAQMALSQLRELVASIDEVVIPCVAGPSMLRLARQLEARDPVLIDFMPRLSGYRAFLGRSASVADALSYRALDKLARAIRDESKR